MKDHISIIDDSILQDLFYAAQFTLNDVDTIERVSAETGLSEERIEALIPIAIDLSMNQQSEITTEGDISALLKESKQTNGTQRHDDKEKELTTEQKNRVEKAVDEFIDFLEGRDLYWKDNL